MQAKKFVVLILFGLPLLPLSINSVLANPHAQIYFVRYNEWRREHGVLYRMNSDGSRQTKMIDLNGTDPAFSPDGRQVVFQSNAGLLGKGSMFAWHENIWIRTLNQKKTAQVADYDSYGPAFSPNGKMIAFMSGYRDPHGPDHQFDIAIKKIGSTKIKLLTRSRDANDTYPSFSPDNKRILFASGPSSSDEESRNIYIIGVNGSNLKRLTNDASGSAPDFKDNSNPVMSANGKKIMFVRGRYTDNGRKYFNSQIFVMDANGTNRIQLTFKGKNNNSLAFSPDGRKIAFVSDRDGNNEIYVMDVNGANQKRLTKDAADDAFPRWIRTSRSR